MNNNSSFALVARIISIVIMLIGVVMWIMLAADNENESLIGSFVSFGNWMVIVGFILAVMSFIASVVLNPSSLKGMLIGVAAIVIIGGISYSMADATVLPSYKDVDESTSKLVSTGLNAFYIVGLLAVLSVLYSGVARLLK